FSIEHLVVFPGVIVFLTQCESERVDGLKLRETLRQQRIVILLHLTRLPRLQLRLDSRVVMNVNEAVFCSYLIEMLLGRIPIGMPLAMVFHRTNDSSMMTLYGQTPLVVAPDLKRPRQ